MLESSINACNAFSHIKSSSTRVSWHIEGLTNFIGLHEDMKLHLEEISCHFQGGLNNSGLPVNWKLFFIHTDKHPTIYLVLKREKSNSKSHSTDKVFISADITILNSQNVNIFSKKSEISSMTDDSVIYFPLGHLDPFANSVSQGNLNVNCTIHQFVWDNVKTSREFSPVEEEINGTLVTDFKNLLDSGDITDVTIKLSDGQVFNAHKAILSARSPVFKRMFTTPMKESINNTVELDDIGEDAMEALLSYIYTGMLNLKGRSTQSLKELVDSADKYQLPNMKDLCNETLLECCDAHNAFELLNLARLHELKDAENEISAFIELNITNILKSTANISW